MLDMRNCVSNEKADSVNALIQFKDKRNHYKLEETATNEFDKQIFKITNESELFGLPKPRETFGRFHKF